MFLPYFLISTNLLFLALTHPNQTLTHRKSAMHHTPVPHCPAPPCHPERRATARSRTRRATVGRDLLSASAPTPAPNFRNGKTPDQHTPLPLAQSLLKGVRGKLFSRKVSPGASHPPTSSDADRLRRCGGEARGTRRAQKRAGRRHGAEGRSWAKNSGSTWRGIKD